MLRVTGEPTFDKLPCHARLRNRLRFLARLHSPLATFARLSALSVTRANQIITGSDGRWRVSLEPSAHIPMGQPFNRSYLWHAILCAVRLRTVLVGKEEPSMKLGLLWPCYWSEREERHKRVSIAVHSPCAVGLHISRGHAHVQLPLNCQAEIFTPGLYARYCLNRL